MKDIYRFPGGHGVVSVMDIEQFARKGSSLCEGC